MCRTRRTSSVGRQIDAMDDNAPARAEPWDFGALVRSARAVSGLSQRELAQASGLSKSTVARAELDASGARTTVRTLTLLLACCGITLVAEGAKGQLLPDADLERDDRGRRFPPHLDPYPPMHRDEWWAPNVLYQCITDALVPWPARTFALDPHRRAQRRVDSDHPWDARFWAVSRERAPAPVVHPELERRRRLDAATGRRPKTAPSPAQLRRLGWHWVEGSATRPNS